MEEIRDLKLATWKEMSQKMQEKNTIFPLQLCSLGPYIIK